MSHRLYHTEGFILRHSPRGEANKLLYLLTPDFGRCLVLAQGVRQEKSKLRPNLVDYSFGHFSLVRGREFWRLVSAEKDSRFTPILAAPGKRLVLGRLFNLLVKLLADEEDSRPIFSDLAAFCHQLANLATDSSLIEVSERLFLLRLIKHLGYWPGGSVLDQFVESSDWSELSLRQLAESPLKQQATQTINHFFHEHNHLV